MLHRWMSHLHLLLALATDSVGPYLAVPRSFVAGSLQASSRLDHRHRCPL